MKQLFCTLCYILIIIIDGVITILTVSIDNESSALWLLAIIDIGLLVNGES